MHIVNTLDESVWRDWVLSHPQGNIFHTSEMFQVLAQASGYHPTLWAAVRDEDGSRGTPLALLLPVEVTLMGGPLRRLTTRAVAYGSILCAPGDEGQAALDALLRAYKRHVGKSCLFTELRNLSNLDACQPVLKDNGFAYAEHLNYLIDLARPTEAIMQHIGKRTRKNIRRALRDEQTRVEVVADRAQLQVLYRLLRKTYAAAQVYLSDISLFEAAFDVLYPKGMARFLLVRVGDEYAAGSVELLFKDTVYGWYGGLDRAFSSYNPNELLTWHILEWGAENGYRVYDFGGAGSPDEEYGVRDFKAKFGGELVCYGRNTCVHAPGLLRMSTLGYRLCKQLQAVESWSAGEVLGR